MFCECFEDLRKLKFRKQQKKTQNCGSSNVGNFNGQFLEQIRKRRILKFSGYNFILFFFDRKMTLVRL